jgi:hypothetical protein
MGRAGDFGPESLEWWFSSESGAQRRGVTGGESSVGQTLAHARPGDPLGMELAQTLVGAQLFGRTDAASLGRFRLLNRLGAGGMGVVYAAYDPELDRTVAVKLLRGSDMRNPAAMEEGRALARLSHPNVVPVFEVGASGDHIYIVMELVLGETLRQWARGRRLREIVRAYRQAGEGLAAAHAVGLVHRDFKPDNAIMGADGRLRVVDFGLACAAGNEDLRPSASRGGGTPRYMAPEQIAGGSITHAADQHALCASLDEALTATAGSKRSQPARWLKAVIDRGRATDPRERFPSMAALVIALGQDPALRRRRRLAAGLVVAVVVLMFLTGRSTVPDGALSCNAGPGRIAGAWEPSGREAALLRLETLGQYGQSVARLLLSQGRQYEAKWATGYRDACQAHRAGVESDALHDRRMACLETGRRSLSALAALVGATDDQDLGQLVLALRALPDPAGCADGRFLLGDQELAPAAIAGQVAQVRNALAGARIRLAAGHLREVRNEAETLVKDARALGYLPLVAEALLLEGHAAMAMAERTAAVAPLTEAYTLGFKVGNHALAVEAWARRAWAQGTTTGGDVALLGKEVVQAVADQKAIPSFARALLYNNIGAVEYAQEHPERARPAFERAAREAANVQGASELLVIPINLALVIDDNEERERLLSRAVAAKAELLGPDHPETLEARWSQGYFTVRFATALEILRSTCARLRPHSDAIAKSCWAEVALIAGELGEGLEAAAASGNAVSIPVAADSDVLSVQPYLHYWRGDFAAAAEAFASALRGLERGPTFAGGAETAPPWDRQARADLEIGLGRSLLALGRPRAARGPLTSAVQGLLDISVKLPSPGVERRLGRARAELARALASSGAPPNELRAHAAPAAEWLRRAGGLDTETGALDRLASVTARRAIARSAPLPGVTSDSSPRPLAR